MQPDRSAMMLDPDSADTGPDAAAALVRGLPRPLVFTNGCFDILHRGHVDYLGKAAAYGRSLVVGVNDDDSVRALGKAPDRPINPLADRMAVLSALRSVDAVVPFSDPTPLALIRAIQPDVLVKGGDWPVDRIVGAGEVKARGGAVYSIPFRYQRSTTELVRRIQGD